MQILKTTQDIAKMKAACEAAASVLDYIEPFIQAGVTTYELDQLCLKYITEVLHAKSATIGYQMSPEFPPYPGSVCISPNHVVCHGIPNDKKLKNGDILNIDVTVIKDGWYGDTSRMFTVGTPSILAKRLIDITYESMWKGIEKVRPGATLGDIGHAIQTHAQNAGFSVVREYCGHGVGKIFHDEPQILHYGKPNTGMKLFEGLTFTIEPMINAGKKDIKHLSDGWTVVTKDHSLTAQWEHVVRVTADGYEVLTLSPNCPPPPSFVKSANT
ncbi:type I methionyl aminopeptidase [Basilea psittacipulmonis]|uniref:Methionine aminopeptidase n=1 Tax=Basilea psittacipulmonis DSM 24701 TaxID=1072685 RepID=A0A077DGN1_9BURK|nr:type I methionyl aminopeptidase [Basilea psittacipulmonis]AIL32627.1 methionine aminopeptidase [Basilea psittacipulmonis DSM 24701]